MLITVMKREFLTDSSSLISRENSSFSTSCTKGKKQERKVYLAVVSGLFATTGSVLGKLASNVEMESSFEVLLKGILLIFMVTSNTIGCQFFVKALNASGSSLPCTIASAATSYICSVLVGSLIFNESTSISWWCGITFVILGLLLICYTPSTNDSKLSPKKSKEE
ncbi:PREDICTED: uncharacterized protein LOC108552493 [Eufriesea mexicana]|uniref:uncharacterized protein LOC108552493 n=1 Tax=Eufriesea mexicana TaxID=516756 RepID=UPI00083C286E|nr:PREDICTED: uncharacterized protein LOC108552493 [Eufriesea mexicana]